LKNGPTPGGITVLKTTSTLLEMTRFDRGTEIDLIERVVFFEDHFAAAGLDHLAGIDIQRMRPDIIGAGSANRLPPFLISHGMNSSHCWAGVGPVQNR